MVVRSVDLMAVQLGNMMVEMMVLKTAELLVVMKAEWMAEKLAELWAA